MHLRHPAATLLPEDASGFREEDLQIFPILLLLRIDN